jgi:hypothetical protein
MQLTPNQRALRAREERPGAFMGNAGAVISVVSANEAAAIVLAGIEPVSVAAMPRGRVQALLFPAAARPALDRFIEARDRMAKMMEVRP